MPQPELMHQLELKSRERAGPEMRNHLDACAQVVVW